MPVFEITSPDRGREIIVLDDVLQQLCFEVVVRRVSDRHADRLKLILKVWIRVSDRSFIPFPP